MAGALRRGRADHLVRGSANLLLSSGLVAGTSFLFWAVAAHLQTAAVVGRATSLVTAVSLISYLALFGLGNTIVGHLPTIARPAVLVGSALVAVALAAVVLAGVYLLLIPVVAPSLQVARSAQGAICFVSIAVLAAVNVLTDSVFIGDRRSQLTVLTDGALQGPAKVIGVVALAGSGTLGIFGAYGVGALVAVASSLYLVRRSVGIRLERRGGLTDLRRTASFSLATYLSSCLNLLPLIVYKGW